MLLWFVLFMYYHMVRAQLYPSLRSRPRRALSCGTYPTQFLFFFQAPRHEAWKTDFYDERVKCAHRIIAGPHVAVHANCANSTLNFA